MKERRMNLKEEIKICEKSLLTVDEAALYTNIGRAKIRELISDKRCEFVLFVGTKALIKRKLFDDYLERLYSI